MNKFWSVFVLCAVTVITSQAQDVDNSDEEVMFNPKIGFDDFKVALYKEKREKLNIHSCHTAWLYRTTLKDGYRTLEINFAGHYILITWGCGSPCIWGAIIDVKTGNVYNIPYSGSGYDCRPNSRMLLVNPPFKSPPPDTRLYYLKNRPYDVPEIYIFNDSTKKFKKYHYENDKR